MDLGGKLKQRRLELNMTLEEVGNIVGVSKSTVMKWETGDIENMRRDKIALLAKALKVSPLFIMGIENEEKSTREEQAKPNTVAAHLPEGVELTEKEQEELNDYIQFILSRRKE